MNAALGIQVISRMGPRAECRGLLIARDSYLVFTVMAAFLELPTDEVELFEDPFSSA